MEILNWPVLVWAIRVALLLLVAAGVWIGFLYVVRYLRPSNIKKVAGREVAEIEEIRALGTALKLHTQKTVKAEEVLETKTEEINELQRIATGLDDRLMQVEDAHQELSRVVKAIAARKSDSPTRDRESE